MGKKSNALIGRIETSMKGLGTALDKAGAKLTDVPKLVKVCQANVGLIKSVLEQGGDATKLESELSSNLERARFSADAASEHVDNAKAHLQATVKTMTELKAYVAKKASKLYFWKSAKSVPASKEFIAKTDVNLAKLAKELAGMDEALQSAQKYLQPV